MARLDLRDPDDRSRLWTGGQFFIEKQYVLLVFAGIWSLLEGLINIVRAFQIRSLGKLV